MTLPQVIEIVAQEMQGDNGPKIVITVWADSFVWDSLTVDDNSDVGQLVIDAAKSAKGNQ